MNTALPADTPPKPRRRIGRWIGLSLLAALLFAGLGAASLWWLNRDAALLRDHLLAGLPSPAKTRVQLNLGWGSLSAARVVVHFLSGVSSEARTAFSAVRAVCVGVYQRSDPFVEPDAATLAALDEKMNRRGWTRCVLVRDSRQTVIVYAATSATDAGGPLRVCLAVAGKRELVVASVRGEIAPLIALTQRHLPANRRSLGLN